MWLAARFNNTYVLQRGKTIREYNDLEGVQKQEFQYNHNKFDMDVKN